VARVVSTLLAYLDPGSGSMILTAIASGVAGVVVTVKMYWRRFLRFLGIRKDEPETEAASKPDSA
jgi:hypothetical protein